MEITITILAKLLKSAWQRWIYDTIYEFPVDRESGVLPISPATELLTADQPHATELVYLGE